MGVHKVMGGLQVLGKKYFTLHGSMHGIALSRMIVRTFRCKKMLKCERRISLMSKTITGTVESDVILSGKKIAL